MKQFDEKLIDANDLLIDVCCMTSFLIFSQFDVINENDFDICLFFLTRFLRALYEKEMNKNVLITRSIFDQI